MGIATGKVILFGEHAVVYGKPGIAVPVTEVCTCVSIRKSDRFSYSTYRGLSYNENHKLQMLFNSLFTNLDISGTNINIEITSTVPEASGLGSSASLSVALIRALSDYYALDLGMERFNSLAYDCEKIFHGSPSGIDNAVIAYQKPIFYQNKKIEILNLKRPLFLIVANTGIKADTKEVVSDVRKKYGMDKKKYQTIIDEIGNISLKARKELERGNLKIIGHLMTQNHKLLQELGVSSNELDYLVELSLSEGAYGAKLAGSGRGGNMIALCDEKNKNGVFRELEKKSKSAIIALVK